ncbi:MAG TPA: 2-C-methyl-D-erythritol 2,4-cyclodiphosphate synthase [Bacteroidales bacterium]|nr:2-C-methyl-D-erythritol 2,4-cyclodiphosphate synthase [Bacteroidales bacterium]
MNIRVGFGYDIHKLAEGRKFMLGGVQIPGNMGAIGHSDADVIIHAIMDALLGAAGMRDIGNHFPDTDASLKDIDSKILLSKTFSLIKNTGFNIGNIDVTLCLEAPKVSQFIAEMKQILQTILELPSGSLSIKATTNEGMGFVGRNEGVAAYAVAVLFKI